MIKAQPVPYTTSVGVKMLTISDIESQSEYTALPVTVVYNDVPYGKAGYSVVRREVYYRDSTDDLTNAQHAALNPGAHVMAALLIAGKINK